MKKLSVIVASQNAETTVAQCLTSLETQITDDTVEIIVVDNSTDTTPRLVKEKFSNVELIDAPKHMLVPHLWAHGASQASGDIIAFTTAHFIPDPNWVSETLSYHESDYAAVGGAIENARPASLTQWGVYFCRYAGYMLPFSPHSVVQIPGDNGSYKRWVFDEYADIIKHGFWETVVNDRLYQDGHSLLMTPSMRVDHGRSFSSMAFCKQRLVHGRIFGADRAQNASTLKRVAYVAASPLVPVVFLGKIARQVFRKKRLWGEFVAALPMSALFILSWSLGESLGYLLGHDSKERSS